MNLFEQQRAWRQSLTAGNEVLIVGRGLQNKSVAVVERVTPTQVIVLNPMGNARRFKKSSGVEVGPGCAHIRQITDEERARVKANQNRQEFGALIYRLDRLADDEVAVMLEAVKALRASKEENEAAP